MKLITLLQLAFVGLLLMSCSALTTISNGKQIDKRLVGAWEGSEKNEQMEGMTKEWIMTRNNDGTFVLDFTFYQDGERRKNVETGNWWVQDGKFYEAHTESGMTDTYTYQVLDKDHIKFKSDMMSMEMNKDSYEFIDTRKTSALEGKSIKDGSSYEKAIKVKSVPDEYKFAKENCTDCTMQSQSLSEKNGKMYDVLSLKKPDGTEVRYYFDITSFYGKMF